MTFDIDEALKCLQEFSAFMTAHDEPWWANRMNMARVALIQVEEKYDQAVSVFLDEVDSMWGGPMGGGLFEFGDQPKWSQGPPDALQRFNMYWDRLSILRKKAQACAAELESENPKPQDDDTSFGE